MASKMKKGVQKAHSPNQGSPIVDIQYVGNDGLGDISWSSIVNSQAKKGASYPQALQKNPPALLAVDCESVSKSHLPLTTSRVIEDCVDLEMTVSSEFTLVGYQDDIDELIPDEETLKKFADSYEDASQRGIAGRKRAKGLATSDDDGKTKVPGPKSSPSGRPRGRPRGVSTIADADRSRSEPRSIVRKNRVLTMKKENLYNCGECDRSFATASGLKIHAAVHSAADGGHTCFTCGRGFETIRGLKTHIAGHDAVGQNVCRECGRWFKDQVVLRKHAGRHDGAPDDRKIADCGMCGENYDTEADLAEHVLGHLSEVKSNICLVCSRHLAPMSSMEKHLRTHTGEKMATCSVCSKKFGEAYNLKSHMRIHTGERPFCCPQCKRRFTSVSTLKNHILTHSDEKHYACTYCEKRFRRSSHLAEHRRSHTGERPYACMHCGKRYTTSTALRSHLISHTNENRFACTMCSFATPRSISLRKHMRSHEPKPEAEGAEPGDSEKQYMCADCGRQFSRIRNMEKHLDEHKRRRELGLDDFSVDSGRSMDKIYGCTRCNRKFARYRNLQKHCLVHGDEELAVRLAGQPFRRIGDKPYVCSECGRLFARVGNMQKHFLTHWNQEVENDASDNEGGADL